jgi:hypothetical protein
LPLTSQTRAWSLCSQNSSPSSRKSFRPSRERAAISVPRRAAPPSTPPKDHASASLGAEPGTGVSVAIIVADPPAGTLEGAESCSENVLVTATADETCFEGSATLCAVSVTFGGDGRIGGAV